MDQLLDQFFADPTVNAVATTVGTAVAIALIALWLAAAWWAYTDAGRRTDNTLAALLAVAWIVLSTPFFLPLSLAVYALARPQHSASEHRTRRLAAELVDQLERDAGTQCFSCSAPVDATWLRCPSCTTWLAQPCVDCGSWSERDLAVCPFCGSEERGAPSVETVTPAQAPAAARARRNRRRARATGVGRQAVPRPSARPTAPEPRAATAPSPLRVG